uniref:PRTRC system protein C n=1 Tax=mine drainage metagenome TaxID=410659 RepID=E6QVT3_9ZZZZ
MALQVNELTRVFKYMGTTLPDPDPKMSVDAVKAVYAHQYPELASADADTETRGHKQITTFQKVIGHKG